MKLLKLLQSYICYCGTTKEEYNEVKKDAYVSNFKIWRALHFMILFFFAIMFIASLPSTLLAKNRIIYLAGLIYTAIIIILFFILKKDSLVAQLLIYLSISLLFLLGALITEKTPQHPAAVFVAMLLITPMFMLDKPYFMGLELICASTIYLVWMHYVKPIEIWKMDLVNVCIFTAIGFVIHIITSSIRIKEFQLIRKIKKQKDTDEMTGLKNKSALTKSINKFMADETKNKGLMFLLDINSFKLINDTYGHDVGDSVISQFGNFLHDYFVHNEVVGRFGGDEFICFIKDTDEKETAIKIAHDIVSGMANYITLPDGKKTISVSIGIAIYHGQEKNYSEIFKKADIALYDAKANQSEHFKIYE